MAKFFTTIEADTINLAETPALLRHLANLLEQQAKNQDTGADPIGETIVDMSGRTHVIEWADGGQVDVAIQKLHEAAQRSAEAEDQMNQLAAALDAQEARVKAFAAKLGLKLADEQADEPAGTTTEPSKEGAPPPNTTAPQA